MSLSAAQIQNLFKLIGKFVFILDASTDHADVYRQATMAAVDQGISGQASEFDLFDQVLTVLKTDVKTAITALGKLPDAMVKSMTNYLTIIVGPQLGVASPTIVTVLDALRGRMDELGLYIGTNWNAFFVETLGYTIMPTAGTTQIPDGWITNSMV